MPPGGHVFPPIKIIWTILVEGQSWTNNFVPNYFEIGPVIFDKKIFLFPFGCDGNQNSAWNWILWTTLKWDHLIINTVKFDDNSPSGLGGDVV